MTAGCRWLRARDNLEPVDRRKLDISAAVAVGLTGLSFALGTTVKNVVFFLYDNR